MKPCKCHEETIQIKKGDDFFGAVLNCAVRYCLGRRSYMPGLVTGWIMEHCAGALTKKTLWCFKKDIDACDNYGMACDIETWMNFRAWVERQEKENDALDSGCNQKQR